MAGVAAGVHRLWPPVMGSVLQLHRPGEPDLHVDITCRGESSMPTTSLTWLFQSTHDPLITWRSQVGAHELRTGVGARL
ncbi:MAG: hypothetical protein JO281_11660 [Pseudonocardiales bacterium]|nr:hypothetical protein [Pseudonocardiales bacterium]